MMTSTSVDISPQPDNRTARTLPGGLVVVLLGVLGTLAALMIGLLTFSVQATIAPDHVPLAVGTVDAAAAPALAPLTGKVAAQGGNAVSWRTVDSRAQAERLLDRKEIYGAVLFSPGPGGLSATVLVSGALNPGATQAAQPALTQVAVNATAAARAQAATEAGPAGPRAGAAAGAASPPVQVVTLHPTSAAGRVLPLAASAMLWLATLVTGVLAVVLGPRLRGGRPLGRPARIGAALAGALLGTAGVLGYAHLWDAALPIGWEAAGFLALVGLAFGLLQAAVLRWLGLPGVGLLGVFYLMAPAVAGQVPELLNPVYRAVLWSWTPFRFSTEALRSLLFLGSNAPDVQPALWLFGGIAVAGLALMLVPGRRRGGDAPAA
jgi:hypothetical protein